MTARLSDRRHKSHIVVLRSCVRTLARFRGTSGASAVEFAILSPLAILILFGIIAYGLVFSTHLSLQHLIAETGRATIPGLASQERQQLARNHFDAKLDAYPLLNPADAELRINDDGQFTEVLITYSVESHPAYVFEGLLPLPASPYIYRQVIRNGGS
ncbi:TadE/TadG family type IV pilus assembly protein [Maricaulis maris]|uniref:TadE-like protein n=1 Tax=Maricaulis maris TaxID=74318 RepID=A0A495D2B8_9PROT|nr:TadE/TadG family type IV pilus assembly protein [Maricaulis maris]RKQ95687.1 TadE-like protein [Maricaulis maris]